MSTFAADTASEQSQIFSVTPVVLAAPRRLVDLEMRVTAPVNGSALPVLLLSHGHGPSNHLSSLNGYAPIAQYFAAHGFIVIQPTHLDSKTLPFRNSKDDPNAPLFWRARAEDMTRVLDGLGTIESSVPSLRGRVDHGRIAVLGHSMGGHTASVLLGARHRDPRGDVSVLEPRIKAGVVLAGVGRGDALSEHAARNYSFFATIDFSSMTTPALVVAGDKDDSPHLTTAGPAWHADPYVLAPSPKSLLTLFGGEHGLGGVAGYAVAETTDEDPDRVAVVQLLSWSYLRSQLYPGDPAWANAQMKLGGATPPMGKVESK